MNNNIFDQSVADELKLTPLAEMYLLETAKWGKFISIVGFIFVGIFVFFAVFSNMFFESSVLGSSLLQTLFFLLYAVIYFFPLFYLFKFSTKITIAINNRDSLVAEESFENLKSIYKFMGILLIISLGIMVISIFSTLVIEVTAGI